MRRANNHRFSNSSHNCGSFKIITDYESQFRLEAGRPDMLTGLIRNNRQPIQTHERLMGESSAAALNWVKAQLSPATVNRDGVKIPDGISVSTASLSKESYVDVGPDANGTIALFMLPFIEAPLAQYDTSTGCFRAIADLALGSEASDGMDWLRSNKIYGYRCTFQSMTAYNTTSVMELQGNVVACLMPSQLDSHQVETPTTRRYVRVIDNIPLTPEAVSASVRKPYMGAAKDGIYIVNRNFTNDWSMLQRDADWMKATTRMYTLTGGEMLAGPFTRNSLAFSTPAGPLRFASRSNTFGVPSDALVTDTTVGVTGLRGTGYGMGVAYFTGLTPGSSFRVKLVHGYEFVMKPGSPYILAETRSPLRENWAFKAVSMQLQDKSAVYPADANFFGALLSGLTKVLPVVMPIARTIWPHLRSGIEKLLAKGEKKAKQATRPPMPTPPSKPPRLAGKKLK